MNGGFFNSVMGMGLQSVVNEKVQEFITNYSQTPGFYDYMCVDVGDNSCFFYNVIAVIFCLASAILFSTLANGQKDPEVSEDSQSSSYKTLSSISGFFLICFLLSVFGGFLFYGLYIINYWRWIYILPPQAKTDMLQIWSLKRAKRHSNNQMRQSMGINL